MMRNLAHGLLNHKNTGNGLTLHCYIPFTEPQAMACMSLEQCQPHVLAYSPELVLQLSCHQMTHVLQQLG
jgi:hypothetical protein